jgi:hypothetical protein
MEALSLHVDFNADDDQGVIRTLRRYANRPDALAVGEPVRLYDAEGNQCLGYVLDLDEEFVSVKVERSTWIDAQPVVVVAQSDDLTAVLRRRVVMVASSQTSTTEEFSTLA